MKQALCFLSQKIKFPGLITILALDFSSVAPDLYAYQGEQSLPLRIFL